MNKLINVDIQNGLILQGFRKQNLLTQEQLGDLIHKSKSQVVRYESGYTTIPDKIIEELNCRYNLKLKSKEQIAKEEKIRRQKAAKISKYEVKLIVDQIKSKMDEIQELLESLE